MTDTDSDFETPNSVDATTNANLDQQKIITKLSIQIDYNGKKNECKIDINTILFIMFEANNLELFSNIIIDIDDPNLIKFKDKNIIEYILKNYNKYPHSFSFVEAILESKFNFNIYIEEMPLLHYIIKRIDRRYKYELIRIIILKHRELLDITYYDRSPISCALNEYDSQSAIIMCSIQVEPPAKRRRIHNLLIESDNICGICMSKMEINNSCTTNCIHAFHSTCLNKNINKCPLCQEKLVVLHSNYSLQ
jgi:hypothetical protein